jgi:hypothetical protein
MLKVKSAGIMSASKGLSSLERWTTYGGFSSYPSVSSVSGHMRTTACLSKKSAHISGIWLTALLGALKTRSLWDNARMLAPGSQRVIRRPDTRGRK